MSNGDNKPGEPQVMDFSKAHHIALRWISKIRECLQEGMEAESISPFLLYYFDADLKHYFSEEQNIMLNRLSSKSWFRQRAESEHREIQELFGQMRKNESNGILIASIADKLERHIYFEQRELFNHMQVRPENIQPGAATTKHRLSALFVSMN